MEGYLQKWTNYFTRWQPRYIRIKNNILEYSKFRFTPTKAVIDLVKC